MTGSFFLRVAKPGGSQSNEVESSLNSAGAPKGLLGLNQMLFQ